MTSYNECGDTIYQGYDLRFRSCQAHLAFTFTLKAKLYLLKVCTQNVQETLFSRR
jgi:hypothetical protein